MKTTFVGAALVAALLGPGRLAAATLGSTGSPCATNAGGVLIVLQPPPPPR